VQVRGCKTFKRSESNRYDRPLLGVGQYRPGDSIAESPASEHPDYDPKDCELYLGSRGWKPSRRTLSEGGPAVVRDRVGDREVAGHDRRFPKGKQPESSPFDEGEDSARATLRGPQWSSTRGPNRESEFARRDEA
jgi:hypothetical protein